MGVTCRVIEGDCLQVLPTLAAGSFDAVITDPPYAQTNESYDSDIACRPDIWRECFRVAKESAALVAFAGSPTYHRIASAIEAGGWRVRQMWAWVYRDGLITSAYPREGFDRLAPAMDPIVFATKGKVLLDLEREGGAWECWAPRTGPEYSGRSTSVRASARMSGQGHWPRSVVASEGVDGFQYFTLSRGADRFARQGHSNQKPISLMQWLVSKLPGGSVLDPFLGSGTTAAACILEGRGCVGIELSSEYAAKARQRIAEAAGPLFTHATRPGAPDES